ncbi:ABC transporter permease [Halalkalibacter hemicellulosilyticus]|uniref:Bacitracin export permease protein BceB n=1 Tax=Halalkalibacter hemicellulosilyticusJCM 9152 TaxID=1236971 RepID=W4QCK4_9BACI|nr:ABC transporter permease [Halalkalibacter hemicellulosilyticus]GAE29765.1 bacitracin export permease protein BceB [Halalkalibacter hemicellulosilyticusJCM 9152]
MTTNRLVIRSMRKNLKMYYLYFFSMIFSVSLYYIFATLQHDSSIVTLTFGSVSFSSAFQVAGILLMVITGVFTIYANDIFLRRRSKELGIYQISGLSKFWIGRLLIVENIVLGAGALIVGIVVGVLLSRFFLIILMRILEVNKVFELSFSIFAVGQTLLIFTILIAITVIQIVIKVSRSTLKELFYAENQKDESKTIHPIISGFLAFVGLALVAFGYDLSTKMVDNIDALFAYMLIVLATTILGTYLIFRMTIGWALYLYRRSKKGNLGLFNSLSIAPFMHRIKGDANSLTIITVLSAMTITMVSLSYSLYYSVEKDTRLSMPFDIAFENMQSEAESFLTDLDKEGIDFYNHQVEGMRFVGEFTQHDNQWEVVQRNIMVFPAEPLQEAGLEINIPAYGEAFHYDSQAIIEENVYSYPIQVGFEDETLTVSDLELKNIMNFNLLGMQLVVSQATFDDFKQEVQGRDNIEFLQIDTFQFEDKDQLEEASLLYMPYVEEDVYMPDYHSVYNEAFQFFGVLIFITAFLGLVFLISMGSILYFKQMTEAEQERRYYKTLRQLGFNVNDILKGIALKQLFVFIIPLLIGISHAVFAIRVASILVRSSILVPTLVGIVLYAMVYLLFALFTVSYYRQIVKKVI